jgi:putative membrane protein
MELSNLPTVNAVLNSISAVLLATGYVFVRQGRLAHHRACMLAAFGTSTLFLVSYLIYHANVGSVPYQGEGLQRAAYFVILISHIVLAAIILPLTLITLTRALTGSFDRHRAIARWTLPIWLYVSVTGVVVYVMLYGAPL